MSYMSFFICQYQFVVTPFRWRDRNGLISPALARFSPLEGVTLTVSRNRVALLGNLVVALIFALFSEVSLAFITFDAYDGW